MKTGTHYQERMAKIAEDQEERQGLWVVFAIAAVGAAVIALAISSSLTHEELVFIGWTILGVAGITMFVALP